MVHHEQFPLVREDLHHPALSINTLIEFPDPIPFPSATKARYNFRKADYVKLYSDLLNADWSFLDAQKDVNVALREFYDVLYQILDNSVPKVGNRNEG